jgi:protocatechuate 3,4-dioxygenase beta subunit
MKCDTLDNSSFCRGIAMDEPINHGRRRLVCGIATLPVSALAVAAIPTPAATEGPFYPTRAMRPTDVDNDLVRIAGEVRQAGGEVVTVGGRLLDRRGNSIAGARVEIWQCDVKGRYLHRGDFGWSSRDKAFQGFGHDISDADGSYSFRTIKPVPYSGRTPHIHVKVLVDNRERLTTQFYLPDHPDNDNDWLYQRIAADKRDLVTLYFGGDEELPRANLDIVV